MAQLRILPATILTAVALLGLKTVELVQGTENLLIATGNAAEGEKATEKKLKEEKPATEKKAETAKKEAKPKEKEAAKPEAKEKSEAKSDGKSGGGEGGKKDKPNPAVSEDPGAALDRHYSAVEIDLLQHLSERHEELDRWERNVQIKEAVLDAAEKRIDTKIQQIDTMKKEVTDLLAKYNGQEDAKINSLVKIYENMKPKDAARIFDQVEMPILLLVIDKMADKKVAPVLAEMDPRKAKQVTVELAEERRINSAKLTPSTSPTAK